MSDTTGKGHAKPNYYQYALEGGRIEVQPKEQDSDSNQGTNNSAQPEFNWQQESYKVTISFIVTKVGLSSNEHEYQLLFNDDADILISPHNPRSKKMSRQVFAIPGEKSRKKTQIPLVFRVDKKGLSALSYPDGYSLLEGTARVFGGFMDKAHRAIECWVLHSSGAASGTDDTGKHTQSSSSSKDVGKRKKSKRSKTLRDEVRDETMAEVTPKLAKSHGKILGLRQGDWEPEF